MPMAGFQDIPNEIAVDIFHFVQQDDLLSLSLTCKSIHDLVEPMLYSTLVVSQFLFSIHTFTSFPFPRDSFLETLEMISGIRRMLADLHANCL